MLCVPPKKPALSRAEHAANSQFSPDSTSTFGVCVDFFPPSLISQSLWLGFVPTGQSQGPEHTLGCDFSCWFYPVKTSSGFAPFGRDTTALRGKERIY